MWGLEAWKQHHMTLIDLFSSFTQAPVRLFGIFGVLIDLQQSRKLYEMLLWSLCLQRAARIHLVLLPTQFESLWLRKHLLTAHKLCLPAWNVAKWPLHHLKSQQNRCVWPESQWFQPQKLGLNVEIHHSTLLRLEVGPSRAPGRMTLQWSGLRGVSLLS